jgi:hypothetical protein
MTRNLIMFYATATDLRPLLSSLETQKNLQYTLAGLFDTNTPQTYLSYVDIPDFGTARHPTSVANSAYLVAPQGATVHVEDVPQRRGGVFYAISQLLNQDTIVFGPGGRHQDDIILYGTIGTVSDSPMSKGLYDFFTRPFRERFKRTGAFFLGPEALDFARIDGRLALSASTPPEHDLKVS